MSNRLPILASEIREAHLAATAATKTAAEKAIAAGHALVEAKALVAHGGWLPFLKEAGIPERTAQRYMTLARGNLNSDMVTDLGGLVPALRFLKLRDQAGQHLDDAEAVARAGVGNELEPIERALDAMDEIVDMFPEQSPSDVHRTADNHHQFQGAAEADKLLGAWNKALPAVREDFARELYAGGEISLDQRNQMIGAAWRTSKANEQVSAEAFARMLLHYLPEQDFAAVRELVKKHRLSGADIAIAIGDALEKRKGGTK